MRTFLFAALLVILSGLTPSSAQAAQKAAPKTGAAQDGGGMCIGLVNGTNETVRLTSKTGSLTRLEVAPRTIDSFCCPTHGSLCFDKSDGSSKLKIVRVDPATPDEWSGPTCRKLYLKPGATISVRYDVDGRHIVCEPAAAKDFIRPFADLDLNRDGKLSEAEAASNRIPPATFRAMDLNGDGVLDKSEYESAFDRINILKGVPF